jgi:hypothetical protein
MSHVCLMRQVDVGGMYLGKFQVVLVILLDTRAEADANLEMT